MSTPSKPASKESSRQPLSEAEGLARDIFIRLTEHPGFIGKTPDGVAEECLRRAEAFMAVVESARSRKL